jgi:signal transduction histidine kinase
VILRALESVKSLVTKAAAEGHAPPPKALALIETMSTLAAVDKIACERILGVVRSLKTFARVHEGDLRKVSVNELLENTIKLVNVVFRRRVRIETRLAEDLPDVECYPGLLNQVFLNVMVNAGQAIEGEGRIEVRSAREGERIHVAIEDSGKGIPPEAHGRIFSAGYTTKPLGEGTGLGLAISRDIVVDAHGGSIGFESQPGAGTTFHIRIPLAQARREQQRNHD